MQWLNNELTKLVIRNVLGTSGAWFVSKGFLTNDEQDKLVGALAVLAGILHHLWTERHDIIAEVKAAFNSGKPTIPPAVKLFIGCLLLAAVFTTGCANTQVVNASKGTGLDLDLPLGYNGANLFEMKLKIGQFLTTTAVQPTSSNHIYAPSVSVASTTDGNVSSPQLGTTGVASVTGGDKYNVNIGGGATTMTNIAGSVTSEAKQ